MVPNIAAELEDLVGALRTTGTGATRLEKARERLLAAARRAADQDRSEAVRRLSDLIRLDDVTRASVAAGACGTLVELGADPAPLEAPLLDRLVPALRRIAEAAPPQPEPPLSPEPVAVIESTPAEPARPSKPPGLIRTAWNLAVALSKLRRALKQQKRELAAGVLTEDERIVSGFWAPTVAMFCARPALRAAHPELHALAKSLGDRAEGCAWLSTVFDVLEDEPLLVIEPATGIGILARLSGADVNFALNMLLMQHFPPHPRLDSKAAGALTGDAQCTGEWVAGVWNLYDWRALDAGLSLPSGQADTGHWIWNEGTPADIPLFEGRRVILLGPAAYARTWPAARTFAAMKPGLRIEKVLEAEEVRSWLDRMVRARQSPA